MKIRVTIDLELPNSYQEFTDAELRTEVYESVIRLPHLEHLNSAINLAAEVRPENARENAILSAAYEESLKWAKITDIPEWSVERL